jgi:hypothetical protein
MTNGSASAGRAMMKVRPLDVAEILVAIAPPHQRRQCNGEHDARQKAAGKQCRNRHTRDRADRDQDEAGWNGLGLRAGSGEQGDQIAGPRATLFHLRKQHRRNGCHVGGFGAGYARNQVHCPDQHVVESATHVTEQAGQERDHRARHAGHLDQ